MAPSQVPSWLTPVSGRPGYYFHNERKQFVTIEDNIVQQRYYEEQYESQRRQAQQAFFANLNAASVQVSAPVQASTWPVQSSTGPVMTPDNFGHVNYGSVNMGIYQPSSLGQNFVGHHHASQQQAPFAPLNNAQAVFGDYNHQYIYQPPVQRSPAPVPAPEPALAATSTDAATVVTPETIDLTAEDSPPRSTGESSNLTNDTSVDTPPEIPQVPETPRAKPNATFWTKGSAYLVRQLASCGGSDQWRLFESMRNYARKEKRHRYCERYWPTEEAAWDDIKAKSQWFLDAEELFTYDLKWSRLDILASLESPSEGEIEKTRELEALVLADKKHLAEALNGKRETKNEREDLAQSFNRLQTSKRAAFEKSTGMPKNNDNVKRAQKNLEEEMLKQKTARQNGTAGKGKGRARTTKKASLKKRKAVACEIRGGSPAKRSRSEEGRLSPTDEASPTVPQGSSPEIGNDIDAEGETDGETPVTAPNEDGDPDWLKNLEKQLLEDDQPWADPGTSVFVNAQEDKEENLDGEDREGEGDEFDESWDSSESEIVYSELVVEYPV